jgi:type VI secretion system secreted protein VgrG
MASTSEGHLFKLDSDLESHELLLSSMKATENLGSLFNYGLEILAEGAMDDDYVALEDVLGESMTVRVTMPGGEERFFNGIVSEFSHVGASEEMAVYAATLRPWLWLLAQTSNCRIFQKKEIPAILGREHAQLVRNM